LGVWVNHLIVHKILPYIIKTKQKQKIPLFWCIVSLWCKYSPFRNLFCVTFLHIGSSGT